MDRPRRQRKTRGRSSALDRLAELRKSGANAVDAVELPKEADVYDVVDQTEYESIVRERRREEDFVVDDGSLGYHDDGEEHLFENEEDKSKKRAAAERRREGQKRARKLNEAAAASAGQAKVSTLFLAQAAKRSGSQVVGPATAAPAAPAGAAAAAPAGLNLDAMLDDLSSNPLRAAPSGTLLDNQALLTKRGPVSLPSAPAAASLGRAGLLAAPAAPAVGVGLPAAAAAADEPALQPMALDFGDDDQAPEAEPEAEAGAEADEGVEETKEAAPKVDAKAALFKAARARTITASAPTQAALQLAAAKPIQQQARDEGTGWWAVDGPEGPEAEAEAEPAAPMASNGAVETKTDAQGRPYVDFYWIDAYETPDSKGKIYMFGKLASGRSCCVVVNDVQRRMLALPRDGFDFAAVRDELKGLVSRIAPNERFRARAVRKLYAFEMPDVPRTEAEYVEFMYSARFPQPSTDKCETGGETFSRIFGGSTRPLESFIMERKLKGPAWLRIYEPSPPRAAVTWCKHEFECGPRSVVVPESAPTDLPDLPLKAMSLSIKTVLNPKTHLHEIVAVTGTVHANVRTDGATDNPRRATHFTAVRALGTSCGPHMPFPPQLRAEVAQVPDLARHLELCANERALLSFLLARLHREDPDVLVGHNLVGYDLDVLFTRLQQLKIPMWHKVGRVRRTRALNLNKHGSKDFAIASFCAGRLLCDTYVSARELLRETNYTLSNLAQRQLQMQRSPIEPVDVPRFFESPMGIVQLAQHAQRDSFIILLLMFKLETLPLTRQLTNISGNLWSRTLKGARAERIEYLLLHKFHSLNYVVPEKKPFEKKRGRQKGSYTGGLVLAPKKGLHDKYVLLLDFKSLYPSIIIEHNICFTTVQRRLEGGRMSSSSSSKVEELGEDPLRPEDEAEDGDDEDEDPEHDVMNEIPELPGRGENEPLAVLPSVLNALLGLRAQVKKELKAEKAKASPDIVRLQQLDIRQKALKLTANSMYGCLGFSSSRFYAKPIAALITARGRDILQSTKDLAETMGHEVIYGDTDSIMVNSGVTPDAEGSRLADVTAMAREIVKRCNSNFRFLELEVDGIFRSMLLLQKKKYAAVLADGTKELKGLDMVRRDWCPLSKEAGRRVLEEILSGKPAEDVVAAIHTFLSELGQRVRAGSVPLDQFVITKGLNKSPNEYPDARAQPHLQVALAMIRAGKPVNAGDHVPYVICNVEGASSAAERARHPDGLSATDVDFNWYLTQQILPPISRLCDSIEGTSQMLLAEQLGLDGARFRAQTRREGDEDADLGVGFTPASQLPDSERFRDCAPLKLRCTSCSEDSPFQGVVRVGDSTTATSGAFCPRCRTEFWGAAEGNFFAARLQGALQLATRAASSKFYAGWQTCNDSACGYRTQQVSVRGDRCLAFGCHGRMQPDFGAQQLYTQLKFFETLFDTERAIARLPPTLTAHVPLAHEDAFKKVFEGAQATVTNSAYHWIEPGLWTTLFRAGTASA